MSKFNHLKKYEVNPETIIEYVIDDLEWEPEPILLMKPATQENKPYWNIMLKRSAQNPVKLARKVNARKMVKENRDQDKELYPKHIIVGWKNIIDVDGNEVEFSEEDCRDFINQLPDWIFDGIRNFAASPENFIDSSKLSKN